MEPNQTDQSSLASKRDGFESITQQVRWLCILIVAATFWALPDNRRLITGLLVLACIYNLLRLTPLSKVRGVGSFIGIMVIDLLFAMAAISVSGGIKSPYIILLTLMSMSAAYWYGIIGLLVAGVLETVFMAGLILQANLDIHDWPRSIIVLALIFTISYYVLRLTKDDRQERSELRQLNLAVLRERQRLEALVNSLGDAVIAMDSAGMIHLANQAAGTLFGASELIGRSFESAVQLFDPQKNTVHLFEQSLPEQEVSRTDLSLRLKDEEISLELRITPLKVNGQSQGSIIVARDITKQKSLDEEREEFISLASHELRTPLAVAEGNLSLAMMPSAGPISQPAMELLKKTYRNIRHLSQVVADITTLDQADKGLLEVELERIDPSELVKSLLADYQPKAAEKGLALTAEINPNIRPVVTSKFRLVEILTNFMTNAIKYTEHGTITIKAEADPQNNGVIISVTDTGAGISTTEQEKIFNKFYRAEDYHTRETEGTGLGLYIVKKLASRLNGEIWLNSELGKGSTFYLRVPQYSLLREDQPKVVAAEVDSFIGGV